MIVETLRRERGLFQLPSKKFYQIGNNLDWPNELFNYMLEAQVDEFLDSTELICKFIERFTHQPSYSGNGDAASSATSAVEEVNYRFLRGGIGYRYSDGEIIKADSELLHSETVVPALEILRLPGYAGAQAEFLKAHEHYRHRRNVEALNECYKAYESLMKSICDKRGWAYDRNKSASHLVETCIKNGLIPPYYHTHMTGLRQILESAVPTPRNKTGAHGAGTTPVSVSDELTSYVIHLTAATLLFLATVEKNVR